MGILSFEGVGIHVKVSDIHASRKFYESLGFTPVFGYGDAEFRASLPEGCPSADEAYRGVTYRLTEDTELEIADGHVAVKSETFTEKVSSAKISGMIRVKSIVPVIEELGARIKFPIRKYYWGSLEVAVRDPDGFVLIFIAKYSDEEYEAVKKLAPVEIIDPQK